MERNRIWDVLVVGAGVAGLAAARALAENGLSVVIVEARDRIGGRIFSIREGKEVIELGAEFVHGRPPELLALIGEAGLELYERTGEFMRVEDGVLQIDSEEQDQTAEDSPLEGLKDYAGPGYTGPDLSFAAYLDQIGVDGMERAEALAFVEGFNAADAREASIRALALQQQAEDAIEGDRVWRIREGYDRLPHFLAERFEAAGGRIALNTPVNVIDWRPGHVTVQAGGGEFTATQAILTLPLGVLQAGTVAFHPRPDSVLEIAQTLRMGRVCRLTLVFSRSFWPETMSFLLTRELLPSVWWTAHPAASHSLTGWVGGPRASSLLGLEAAELYVTALSALAVALQMEATDLKAILMSAHIHDWEADAYSRGAYSWIPVGALDQPARMAEPVGGTLFFAGEHTDTTGHWGTVHGALGTGIRAARQVLDGRVTAKG